MLIRWQLQFGVLHLLLDGLLLGGLLPGEAHHGRRDAHRICALFRLEHIQEFVFVAALERDARRTYRTVPARLAAVV